MPTPSSRDTPLIDKAMLVLMGNNHAIMDRVRAGRRRAAPRRPWPGCSSAAEGYGVKVVNPGGVEQWKQGRGKLAALDDAVDHFDVTPRQILTGWPARSTSSGCRTRSTCTA